jgi:DNA-binding SARP family transcriptional activator
VSSAKTSLRQSVAAERLDRIRIASGEQARTKRPPAATELDLRLINGFEFFGDGNPIFFPLSVQRLLAFLALSDRPLQRLYVACKLWIDTTEERAFANLRSTLWRANRSGHRLVAVVSSQLALAPEVRVDVREARGQARRLVEGAAPAEELNLDGLVLGGELLPDWYDDWVLIERERYRQMGLHALEALAERLTKLGRYGEAADAALAAIAGEPLRESAHRTLIGVHVAEGNPSEALRQYELYRKMMSEVLSLAPSPRMEALVDGLTRR